jgi:hypothetical protein
MFVADISRLAELASICARHASDHRPDAERFYRRAGARHPTRQPGHAQYTAWSTVASWSKTGRPANARTPAHGGGAEHGHWVLVGR